MTVPLDPKKAEIYRQKLSDALKGKPKSEEHKLKLRNAKRRKPPPGWLGKKRNPDGTEKDKGKQTTSWYQRNREYAKQKRKTYYRMILEEKAGRPKPEQCESCGGTRRICFDHNHKTGKFRGWLCERCNVILGFSNDDINCLISLVEYLKKNL